jgi:hypothetical protein
LNGTARSIALGVRCAGGVIALGYLLGFVAGPLVPVIGGLALMTFGHGLVLDRQSRTFAAAGLAIVAGAVGIGALRWGAMGLDAIRGAQQVLGPTVLVGPTQAATASWMAATAAVLGLAVWIAPSFPQTVTERVAWVLEAAIGSLAVVWIFWGGAHDAASGSATSATALMQWAAAVGAACLVAVGVALVMGRLGPRWRWAIPALAGAGVVGAASLIASVL